MNKWLFNQNGFTKTSLSAIVTRVSDFVEENVCVCVCVCVCVRVCVCVCLHCQGSLSLSQCIQSRIAKQDRNALNMFKALNKGFK